MDEDTKCEPREEDQFCQCCGEIPALLLTWCGKLLGMASSGSDWGTPTIQHYICGIHVLPLLSENCGIIQWDNTKPTHSRCVYGLHGEVLSWLTRSLSFPQSNQAGISSDPNNGSVLKNWISGANYNSCETVLHWTSACIQDQRVATLYWHRT